MSSNTQKLQKIVDALNVSPWNKKLTLVTLSEILAEPAKAVALLQEVAEVIKPVPLSDDQPYPKPNNTEEAVQQIADYAACVCFNVEGGVTYDRQSFATQLQQPNSQQMLDLLYDILKDLPAAKQRAYVSKYKAPMIIPGDIQQN